MARRREFDVFSWSFLDCITCGFGAVVLMFVIINAQVASRADKASEPLKSETSKLEQEVLDGRKNLVRLKATLDERREQRDLTSAETQRLKEILARLREELSRTQSESLAREENVAKLKSDIQQLEEANQRLTARSASRAPDGGSSLRSFSGEGSRQYLTGVRMGGTHVLILVDTSASMLARNYVNVVRFRSLPDDLQRQAPKWRQVVRTVDWITAQLKPGTNVQVYGFNEQAHSLVPGTDGTWITVKDGSEVTKAVEALRQLVPRKGTSLVNALDVINRLSPQPDNVFLVTDGLPTAGRTAPAQAEDVTPDKRRSLFDQAERSVPRRVPINVVLFPMDGDPDASGYFWHLAWQSGGSLLAPSRDWP